MHLPAQTNAMQVNKMEIEQEVQEKRPGTQQAATHELAGDGHKAKERERQKEKKDEIQIEGKNIVIIFEKMKS
uniref:Uncharacterized protein n=1 Tax=Oryza glumipatula TaxID=40148 RepID=A0A0E0BE63_9ORYZ